MPLTEIPIIGVMGNMLRAFRDHSEIVCGVRKNRSKDGFLKRWTGNSHYWLSELMPLRYPKMRVRNIKPCCYRSESREPAPSRATG